MGRKDRKSVKRQHPSQGLATVILAPILGLACTVNANLSDPCGRLARGEVVVASWWERGADAEARTELEKGFATCNPKATLTADVFSSKSRLNAELAHRLAWSPNEGDAGANMGQASDENAGPVDVIIYNPDIVTRYARCGDDQSRLRSLKFSDGNGYTAIQFDPALMSALSCPDGKVYALPVGLHQLNNLFFNQELASALGIKQEQLTTWAGFINALSKARKLEPALPLLALKKSDDVWSQLTFENIMVGAEGADAYHDLWAGNFRGSSVDFRTNELAKTLARLRQLSSYIEMLDDPLNAVADSEALFTVTGDWWRPPSSVVRIPFPDTAEVFVYTADVLAIAHNAQNVEGAHAFLRSSTSAEISQRFVKKKGAYPARQDLLNAALGDIKRVPALPLLLPAGLFDDLGGHLRSWAQDDTPISEITNEIYIDYCLMQHANRCELEPDPQ